ncbi:MAG: flagellar protein FlgN [Gammaproteobacteria bacterium]|nr:flagellar protein FlgN [Gammaproteobacteria bacterium]
MPLAANHEFCDRLLQLLKAELESSRQLLLILQQEQSALIDGEAEHICSINDMKQRQINLLGEQLLKRDHLLTALQLPAGKTGTEQCIALTAENSELENCWNQLQQLALQLKMRNEVNGGMVVQAQRHVRQMLNILTCQSDQSTTYGRGGAEKLRLPQSLARI